MYGAVLVLVAIASGLVIIQFRIFALLLAIHTTLKGLK